MRRPVLPALAASALGLCFAVAGRHVARAGEDPAPAPVAEANPLAAAEAAKLFERGEVLREEGKWDEAAVAYGGALDHDEGAWVTHVRYQEAVTRAGKKAELPAEYDEMAKKRTGDAAIVLHRMRLDPPVERVAALTKLLRTRPNDPFVLLELGRAQLAAKDQAGARKSLESAYGQRSSDTGEFLLLSAEGLRLGGAPNDARARLEAAVRAKPDLWDAHLALGRMDLADGAHAEAVKRAEQVLGMRPSYLAAFLLKSEAAARLGKVEDSLSALESALRVNPADVDVLIALADLTAKPGTDEGLRKALDVYKKALARDPASLRAHYGVGWVLERQNLLNESLAAYREAMLIAPEDAGVVNSVGVILLKQKRFQDAVVQFQKAIGLEPQSPAAYNNMGAVADAQSDWNEAIKWYAKVLKLKGHDKNVRALLNTAFDYEQLSSFAKAEEYLVKVRAIRPDDDEVITFLGDNYYFQHKYKAAIKAYQDAVKLNAKNRYAWRGLGFSLWEDEKPEDAIDAFEHAKALKADDQNVLLSLGDLYASLDNSEKAVENYEAYVKAGGNNPDVPGLIEQLKQDIANKK
jgi:tetratricopeptide (TPR) repeat protein